MAVAAPVYVSKRGKGIIMQQATVILCDLLYWAMPQALASMIHRLVTTSQAFRMTTGLFFSGMNSMARF